jgi:hypothetical protein
MKCYFLVKDGAVNENGERDDAGMIVDVDGLDTEEEVFAHIENILPCYRGRLKLITKEEYEKDFD